jgi:ammonia channel protein AmtB
MEWSRFISLFFPLFSVFSFLAITLSILAGIIAIRDKNTRYIWHSLSWFVFYYFIQALKIIGEYYGTEI